MSRQKIKRVGSGVVVQTSKARYALDKVPKNVGADLYLVSHAHTDHLPSGQNLKVIASRETIELAKARGYRYTRLDEDRYPDIELIDNGHILGSKAFLIEGNILYTGDINIFDREFLRGFRPPQADILIIEATYGTRKYIFGEYNELIDRLIQTVYKAVMNNINIVLEAYPLGKTQLLTNIFRSYENLYVTRSVKRYNETYKQLGYLDKARYRTWGREEIEEPFILIKGTTSNIGLDGLKYGTKVLRLTGWVVGKEDRGIPLSDHADYLGLLRVVDRVKPKKIYTIYGYATRLAHDLSRMGYDAQPL